jgi:hypothetical protein
MYSALPENTLTKVQHWCKIWPLSLRGRNQMHHEKIMKLTVAAQALAVALIVWLSLNFKVDLYVYIFTILLIIGAIGIKISARQIPWRDLVFVVGAVLTISTLVHFLIFHLHWSMVWHFVGELAITAVCVQFFGRRWVKAGQMDSSRNYMED